MKKQLMLCLLVATIALLLAQPPNASANIGWNIQVTTSLDKTTVVTYDQMLSLPRTSVNAEMYSYGFLVTNGVWEGVKLTDLLNYVGLNPTSPAINFKAQDGYQISIPLDMALQANVIIAYQKDGQPLPETYRLILPQSNGNLWIPLIISISPNSQVDMQRQIAEGSIAMPNPASFSKSQQTVPSPTPTAISIGSQQTALPSNVENPNAVLPPINATQVPVERDIPVENSNSNVQIIYTTALAAISAIIIASFMTVRSIKRRVQ